MFEDATDADDDADNVNSFSKCADAAVKPGPLIVITTMNEDGDDEKKGGMVMSIMKKYGRDGWFRPTSFILISRRSMVPTSFILMS